MVRKVATARLDTLVADFAGEVLANSWHTNIETKKLMLATEGKPGDTIAVWGCGPVGQFAIKSAYMLGAARAGAGPCRFFSAGRHTPRITCASDSAMMAESAVHSEASAARA